MALYPWRFQAEVAKGEIDPEVTVFVGGERFVLDDNGEPTSETFIQQDTSDPVRTTLSGLSGLLADTAALTELRAEQKSKRSVDFR